MTQETADRPLIEFSTRGIRPFRRRVEVSMAKAVQPPHHDERAGPSAPAVDLDLDRMRKAVSGIRYGEVRVIIQDGVIVQIERIEKQRLR